MKLLISGSLAAAVLMVASLVPDNTLGTPAPQAPTPQAAAPAETAPPGGGQGEEFTGSVWGSSQKDGPVRLSVLPGRVRLGAQATGYLPAPSREVVVAPGQQIDAVFDLERIR